jgi:tRNA threonylcarbamoyl adenosine modification protein YeaZ
MIAPALAIDTTCYHYTVAVSTRGEIVSLHQETAARKLDQRIFPAIRSVLEESSAELGELDRLIVGQGPGSFVGTRIGMSVANTLAMVLDIPVVAVDTFSVLAETAATSDCSDQVVTAVNCFRDSVFFRRFVIGDGRPRATGEVQTATFSAFADEVGEEDVVFKLTQLTHTVERETIELLPSVQIPSFDDALRALVSLGSRATPKRADSHWDLPCPLYIKPETTTCRK